MKFYIKVFLYAISTSGIWRYVLKTIETNILWKTFIAFIVENCIIKWRRIVYILYTLYRTGTYKGFFFRKCFYEKQNKYVIAHKDSVWYVNWQLNPKSYWYSLRASENTQHSPKPREVPYMDNGYGPDIFFHCFFPNTSGARKRFMLFFLEKFTLYVN